MKNTTLLIFIFLAYAHARPALAWSGTRFGYAPMKMAQRKEAIEENLTPPAESRPEIREPADLLDRIPVVRDIKRWFPKQFSIANHRCTASSNELTIEHHWDNVVSRSLPKNATITLSLSSPVADGFSTRMDFPLFYSPGVGTRQWNAYPAGNYTLKVKRGDSSADRSLMIRATTHF